MRLSQRLQDEKAYVEAQCAGTICATCGATLKTYGSMCSADLCDPCEGFNTIEAAKQRFSALNPFLHPTSTGSAGE